MNYSAPSKYDSFKISYDNRNLVMVNDEPCKCRTAFSSLFLKLTIDIKKDD